MNINNNRGFDVGVESSFGHVVANILEVHVQIYNFAYNLEQPQYNTY